MQQLLIRPVFTGGMHHYGRRELSVGTNYLLQLEPNNKYDNNAVAIYDGLRKKGNLKRDSAKIMSKIIRLNVAKSQNWPGTNV